MTSVRRRALAACASSCRPATACVQSEVLEVGSGATKDALDLTATRPCLQWCTCAGGGIDESSPRFGDAERASSPQSPSPSAHGAISSTVPGGGVRVFLAHGHLRHREHPPRKQQVQHSCADSGLDRLCLRRGRHQAIVAQGRDRLFCATSLEPVLLTSPPPPQQAHTHRIHFAAASNHGHQDGLLLDTTSLRSLRPRECRQSRSTPSARTTLLFRTWGDPGPSIPPPMRACRYSRTPPTQPATSTPIATARHLLVSRIH